MARKSRTIICHRFPLTKLSPLDQLRGSWQLCKTQVEGEGERGAMPSYESSMRNLAKARAKWRPPRPWRSVDESRMIQRYVFLWFTGARKPSGREWARQLGISHTWLQKLVRKFQADPNEMWRLQRVKGAPRFEDLTRARAYSRQMRERGELRGDSHLSRGAKWARLSERY